MSETLQSICILGRQPTLGIAELESLYGADTVTSINSQVAGLSLPASQIDFRRLGGSTRLARVCAIVPTKLWKDVEKQIIKTVLALAGELPEGKLQLGLSCYGVPITPAKLTATGLTVKKIVRAKTNRSMRLSPNTELEQNTAQVLHNHLLGNTGIELLIAATEDGQTLIARTTAVQDITSYTLRDRGRPKRDARVGMLPPKLAQIIINLAVGQNQPVLRTVLDPFCGTGVILQEAILMGYEAYGSDLEARMVEFSQENLAWLTQRFPDTSPRSNEILEVGDATSYQWTKTPDIVATETYLGRPFTERPSLVMIAQTSTEVNLILKKFLTNIHGQLAVGTRLCLAVPAWQTAPGQFEHLPLIDQMSDLGYNRIRFEHVQDSNLLYYREDQFTARELLVLTRK